MLDEYFKGWSMNEIKGTSTNVLLYILLSKNCTYINSTQLHKKRKKSTLPVQINTKYDNGIYFWYIWNRCNTRKKYSCLSLLKIETQENGSWFDFRNEMIDTVTGSVMYWLGVLGAKKKKIIFLSTNGDAVRCLKRDWCTVSCRNSFGISGVDVTITREPNVHRICLRSNDWCEYQMTENNYNLIEVFSSEEWNQAFIMYAT